MKIALLTLPLNNNFGGILQAYALHQTLSSRGHEAFHVEENGKRSVVHLSSFRFYSWWYTRRLFRQILTLNLNKRRSREDRNRYNLWRNTAFIRAFVAHHVPIKTVDRFDDLKKQNIDAIVVGSDQIWRPRYYKAIEDAFLSFAANWPVKKVAYAPSFGVVDWEFSDEQTKQCSGLLQQFNAVSVREDEGVRMCREKFKVDATRLLDPTLLLNRSAYENLAGKKIKTNEGQLTTYILDIDAEKQAIIHEITAMKEVQLVELGLASHGDKTSDDNVSKGSIGQWLQGFMQAEFIFTDSFHGCVFAILFHKPFVIYGNKNRGLSRFNTLLRLFQLEERMVFTPDQIRFLYDREIDWEKVDAILARERERSASFLKDAGL